MFKSASMSFPLFVFIFSKLLFILLLQTERMRIYRSQWVWGADFSGPCRSRGSRASPFLRGVGRRIELSQSKESPHFPGTDKWQPLVMHLPWETYAFFHSFATTKFPPRAAYGLTRNASTLLAIRASGQQEAGGTWDKTNKNGKASTSRVIECWQDIFSFPVMFYVHWTLCIKLHQTSIVFRNTWLTLKRETDYLT